jgi:hypothetical protein
VAEYLPEDVKKVFEVPVETPDATPKIDTPMQTVVEPKVATPVAPPSPSKPVTKPTVSDLQLRLETLRNLEKQMQLDSDLVADVRAEKLRLKEGIRQN